MKNKDIKYEYYLLTWGGFYNEDHKHGYKSGDYWFDTLEERDKYIQDLNIAEANYPKAKHLCMETNEGYHLRQKIELHRVIEFEGKEYYSNYSFGYGYPFSSANYFLEYKWRPGFNDYPLGDDFDYEKVRIIQEWITGSFKPEN